VRRFLTGRRRVWDRPCSLTDRARGHAQVPYDRAPVAAYLGRSVLEAPPDQLALLKPSERPLHRADAAPRPSGDAGVARPAAPAVVVGVIREGD